MVLSLKTWKSRSLPGLQRTDLQGSPLDTISRFKNTGSRHRLPVFFCALCPAEMLALYDRRYALIGLIFT
jgi:hypothetical protein